MPKYCKKCGKELEPGAKCGCHQDKLEQIGKVFRDVVKQVSPLLAKLLRKIGIGTPATASETVFEDEQQIVPDIVRANDGETSIRQYEAATMRSRIRGSYAKGRLQVTNKRVIFRAAGISLQGPIVQQYEFSIHEISGIEIKKKNRISFMNLFLAGFLNLFGISLGSALFDKFAREYPLFAFLVALTFTVACAIPFFTLHKRFWLKLLVLNLGVGALTAVSIGELNVWQLFTGITGLNTSIYFNGIYYMLWLINVLLVAMVPDLVLVIKTKGSGPAFEIRRKQFPTLFKPMVEYTDFGEVRPGEDIDLMIAELGSLIDDIQTLGDMAIEKWKEN